MRQRCYKKAQNDHNKILNMKNNNKNFRDPKLVWNGTIFDNMY